MAGSSNNDDFGFTVSGVAFDAARGSGAQEISRAASMLMGPVVGGRDGLKISKDAQLGQQPGMHNE